MISEEVFISNLGIHIRQLREAKKISQQGLADLCDMPKTSIGRVERGEVNVTIKSLIKIANALEISFNDLFMFNFK